jgi:hypothetical protein
MNRKLKQYMSEKFGVLPNLLTIYACCLSWLYQLNRIRITLRLWTVNSELHAKKKSPPSLSRYPVWVKQKVKLSL